MNVCPSLVVNYLWLEARGLSLIDRRHAPIGATDSNGNRDVYESTEGKLAALVDERERAILALRSKYDNWPKNLDLADVIEIVFKEFEKELIEDLSREISDASSFEL